MLAERVAETGCPIVYVNQVGGQDELVFDGASLVDRAATARGGLGRASSSRRSWWSTWTSTRPGRPAPLPARRSADAAGGGQHHLRGRRALPPGARWPPVLDPEAEVYEALVLGTRDYVAKNGFTDAVIGLSGGIDSSLVAAIAVDALGPDHVHGVTMPSRYSSEGSVADAVILAANLGIDLATVAIEEAHRALAATLAPLTRGEPDRADRREPAVADPGRAAHGAVQRQRAGSCSPPATRARWPPATRPSTATRPAGSR